MTEKFALDDLIKIAKRENNTKRAYLYVNPLQGKHIPVSPSLSVALFTLLAKKLEERYPKERILVIGFAETATAIGATLAYQAKNAAYYMSTTRESREGAEYLFFTESHSHAQEQRLIVNGLDKILDEVDWIVFAEDEVTTGNTIEKIIRLLQKKYPDKELKFAIFSLLNSMSEERMEKLASEGFFCDYLYHIPPLYRTEEIEQYSYEKEEEKGKEKEINSNFVEKDKILPIRRISKENYWDARIAENVNEMRRAVDAFTDSALDFLEELEEAESILILGTEEFMFPGIWLGRKLEKQWPGKKIRFHATTRSPIEISKGEGYPLQSRAELESLYEAGRKTFLYNLDRYDRVLILTDARENWKKGLEDLAEALRQYGNEKIRLIQWGEFEDADELCEGRG